MAEAIKRAYAAEAIEPFYVGGTSAAFSGDGVLVATPVNEDVVITNLESSKIIHRIEGDGELVTALAMTPDGNKVAVVSQSQQLRVYDTEDGQMVKQFRLSAPVYIARADETLTLFAFGGTDGVVTVWDVEGGYVTHTLKGHGTTISSLAFYGRAHTAKWWLALGDTMGQTKVWDLVKRKNIATHNEHSGAVRGLAFSQDGQFLMSGGRDGVVAMYRTEQMRRNINTFAVRHQVESCGFFDVAGLGTVFYTAGGDNQLKVWEMDSGRPIGGSRKPMETQEELLIIDVAQCGEVLWLVVSDQTLIEVAVGESESRADSEEEVFFKIQRTVAGNHGIVADLRCLGTGLKVALATNAPALRIVDLQRPLDVKLYEGHTDLLNCIDVSEDGTWILTGSKDNEARLWRVHPDTGAVEAFARFVGHAGAVTAVGLPQSTNAPDKVPRFVLTAGADLTVKKWRVPSEGGTVRASDYTRRAHDKEINSLAVAPNDELFATASFDKLAKVWHVTSGDTVGVLRGHKRGLWDISFCHYDKLVCTCSGDKTAKVWLLADYTCTHTLEGHTNAVQRGRFLAQNRQLVTTGADGLVKVWLLKELQCVATLDNHDNRVWAMDVRDDGASLVTADADGVTTVWRDRSDELDEEARRKETEKVEQEQQLANYIGRNDWSNAFLLALTLDHSMRLYNVVRSAIAANADPDSPVGSRDLELTMSSLLPELTDALLRRVRDWNVNFRHFAVAQSVLRVVLHSLDLDRPAVKRLVDHIIPYNERHYQRLDDLNQLAYMLDYTVHEMEKL